MIEQNKILTLCVLGDGFVKGVGDGEVIGWSGRLVKASALEHGPITYYNLGVPNETTVEVARRVKELVPRMVKGADNRLILSFGVADTELVDDKPRLSSQESVEALTQLISQTRRHFKLIQVGLPPVYEPQRNNRVRRLNGLFRDLCSKAHVPFIDIYPALNEHTQYKRELAMGDKVHPSTEGYDKIADLILNDRQWWFS